MTLKDIRKIIGRNIGWVFLKFFTIIHGNFPLGWSYFLGYVFGGFAYTVLFPHRKIALESLSVAFPKMPLREKKKLARDFFVFMGQSALEVLYALKNPRHLDNVRFEGKEHLDAALKQGKGVMMISAHLGNFPLMSLKLANQGYAVNIVARPMRDEKAGNYLESLRVNVGVKTIPSYPRKECVNGIIRALRNGEIVIIQMDQNFGTGGVWVKFFGTLAATPTGPVVFALRTQSVVIPSYIYREDWGKHVFKICPQENLEICLDNDQTILLNVIKFTRIIESWIRDVPGQWGWIHKRWKSRPSEKVFRDKFQVEM